MAPPALGAEPTTTIPLAEAYRRAADRSVEVRSLDARIAEANAQVNRAWALIKPQWTASYTFTHLEPGPPQVSFPEPLDFTTPAIRDNCVQGASTDQLTACVGGLVDELNRVANAPPRTLDLARQDTHAFNTRVVWNPLNGSAIPLIKNAKDNVERERQRAKARVDELMLVVARTYYAALATKEARLAAERADRRAQDQLALENTRQQIGERAPLLTKGVRIASKQAGIDARRAHVAHRRALLALALVTFSEDRPDVEWPSTTPERPTASRDELLVLAESQRSDLTAAKTALTMAERSESEVWWRFVPTVGVFGGFRFANVPGITGQRDQWSVGLAATITLYDGGLRYADLDAARARYQAASLAVEAMRLRLVGDVDRALLDLEAADLALARADEAKALGEQNLELSNARFEVGALRPFELKRANDALLDADVAIARARAEQAIAIFALRAATGTLK